MATSSRSTWRRTLGVPIALFFLVALSGLLRWAWVWQCEAHVQAKTAALGEKIRPALASGEIPDGSVYRKFMAEEPGVGYLVFANYRTEYRTGLLNPAVLQRGANDVDMFRRRNGDPTTLARLIRSDAGFRGEYLSVFSVNYIPPPDQADQTPMGVLKVGYVIPGYPFGRGLEILWAIFSGAFALVAVIWIGVSARMSKLSKPAISIESDVVPIEDEHSSAPAEDLAWLEKELDKPEKMEVDEEGKTWTVLFNEIDLDGWFPKGNWYVSEGDMIGQPWCSSIVSTRVSVEGAYVLRFSGRVAAGPDGFVVLIPCNGKQLAWVIGGWGNTRSEIAGYPETRKDGSLTKRQWYDVEVRVGPENIEGFVGGERFWELSRTAIHESSPDIGFQEGLGVAVWNTLARFRDFRFRTI